MTIQDLFKALNLTLKGRNWADIAPGVTLHLSAVSDQVLWIIVRTDDAPYTSASGWTPLGGYTVDYLEGLVDGATAG